MNCEKLWKSFFACQVPMLPQTCIPLILCSLYNYMKLGSREVEVELCSQVPSDRSSGNGLKLYQGRFSLDIRKKFFTKWVVQPRQRLHRAVVESPSLEGFKRYIDVALGDMV